MKRYHRAIFVVGISLVALALVGMVLARYWLSAPAAQHAPVNAPNKALVDEQPLTNAQHLASLVSSSEEHEFAQQALLIADHEVDLEFAAALYKATRHPAPPSAAARPILVQIETSKDRIKSEQAEITRLKQQESKADDRRKADLAEEIELAEVILEVDQEELDAAKQELIRAGGDPRSTVQRLMEQHDAGHQTQNAPPSATAAAAKPQETNSRTVLVQWRTWRELTTTETELAKARQELKDRGVALTEERHGAKSNTGSPSVEPAQPTPTPVGGLSQSQEIVSALKRVAEDQKNLAELDKRIQDLQQVDAIYSQWDTLVKQRKHTAFMALVEGAFWILLLLVLVLFANPLLRLILAKLVPNNRRGRTIHTVAAFGLQVTAVALILLVVFGPPNQLATVVALAGAGLTVALKDFIVGFFGWFILMGRNGIRPGDWVEINSVGGEVLEVGLLHTVLLETGNWSDAGHPTGRKVTFVNSFAIEGHYFNFSTTGQWLWDEIEVPIPAGVDPYPIAEAVQKAVLTETEANMKQAELEWQRVVPGLGGHSFNAAPAINVRPTQLGVNVIVRYIARANDRHEIRSRLFHEIVELLRSKHITEIPLENASKPDAAAD